MRQALKEARLKNKLKVREVADAVGVTASTYYKWEIGDRTPKILHMEKLSEILRVRVDKLFFEPKLDKTSRKGA